MFSLFNTATVIYFDRKLARKEIDLELELFYFAATRVIKIYCAIVLLKIRA